MVPNQDNSIEITEHQALFSILPSWIEDTVRQLLEHDNSPTTLSKNSFITNTEDLLEIILDLGRPAEARFLTGDIYLSDRELTRDDLALSLIHI